MGRRKGFGSFVVVAVLAVACSDPVLPPTLLTVSPSPVTLALGETARLSTSLRDANGTAVVALISWSTSAPAVASVTEGLVTALKPGRADITASAAGLSGTASVTVEDRKAPTVTLLSPVPGATVEGMVNVVARVADDHRVARVTLSVDGVEVDRTEPTSTTGVTTTLRWNANGASDGTHILLVEATDSTGNIGTSSVSVNVEVETPPFVLTISGTVTSSGFNTATRREECSSVITAKASGGEPRTRAKWLSGRAEYRDVNGLVMRTDTLDAGDLLDYFGSSHISTGATQVVQRLDWNVNKFDVAYTFRAALPDSTLRSIDVFLDCY